MPRKSGVVQRGQLSKKIFEQLINTNFKNHYLKEIILSRILCEGGVKSVLAPKVNFRY